MDIIFGSKNAMFPILFGYGMMPAVSIKEHKLNSDTVRTSFPIKSNPECKSLMNMGLISKRLTSAEETLGAKSLTISVLKSAGAKKESIVL
jgi:hypothetical protein